MSTTSRGAALPQNGMKLLGHAAANSLEMFTNTGEYTRATQESVRPRRATPPVILAVHVLKSHATLLFYCEPTRGMSPRKPRSLAARLYLRTVRIDQITAVDIARKYRANTGEHTRATQNSAAPRHATPPCHPKISSSQPCHPAVPPKILQSPGVPPRRGLSKNSIDRPAGAVQNGLRNLTSIRQAGAGTSLPYTTWRPVVSCTT